MNKSLVTATLALGFGMVSTSQAEATNLVVNPGFETGDFTGWTTGGPPGDIGVDSFPSDVNSGSFGVFFGGLPGGPATLQQTIATTPGAKYRIDFSLSEYQADATTGYFTASFGGTPFVDLIEPVQQDFTQYSATVTASSSASVLLFTGYNPPGWFGFDDVGVSQVSTVPLPGAATLFASVLFGLTTLAGLRRRKSC